jgi:hypothetical protein
MAVNPVTKAGAIAAKLKDSSLGNVSIGKTLAVVSAAGLLLVSASGKAITFYDPSAASAEQPIALVNDLVTGGITAAATAETVKRLNLEKVPLSAVGTPSGVASLDSSGRLLAQQLPPGYSPVALVDSLTSGDAGAALTAKQGKVLADQAAALGTSVTQASMQATQAAMIAGQAAATAAAKVAVAGPIGGTAAAPTIFGFSSLEALYAALDSRYTQGGNPGGNGGADDGVPGGAGGDIYDDGTPGTSGTGSIDDGAP